jgi:hypothetical protein
MRRIEKTVFISYRHSNVSWALAIFQNLTHHGYDVFFDYTGIASGDFERGILGNIEARAHFLVLLTPSALERCNEPNDWLRREIEYAISSQRNVIPLMLEGFDFGKPEITSRLTGALATLRRFNALEVYAAYFSEAMVRLRETFLNVPLDAVVQPISYLAQQAAKQQQEAANTAAVIQEKELTAEELFERGLKAADLNDSTQTIALFRRAADAGSAIAMGYLGFIYEDGIGLPKDDAQAAVWYRKAADAGSAIAMGYLGSMYESGRGGLPQNDAQGVAWFRKAADAGNGTAMSWLGYLYLNGRSGLPKDDAQAVAWYRKAADADDASAMSNLGYMYENGRGGLPKDKAQAAAWYDKSGRVGH